MIYKLMLQATRYLGVLFLAYQAIGVVYGGKAVMPLICPNTLILSRLGLGLN